MSIHDLIANSERSSATLWLNREGEHFLSLKRFGTEELPNAGQKMIAKFEVIKSDAFPSGSEVSFSWDVYNNVPRWRDNSVKQVKTFLCELLGTNDVGGAEIKAVEDGDHEGATIKAIGVEKPPKPRKDNPTEMTKPFVDVYFHSWSQGGNTMPAPSVTTPAATSSLLGSLKK